MSLTISAPDNTTTGLLYVGFNQDGGCFAVGMQNGFRIYNTDPLKQKERFDFHTREGSGIGHVEMLFRTNLLGILGGGTKPCLKANKAVIWDDIKKKFIIEFTYASDIRAMRLRRDRVVVVLTSSIKVYTFESEPAFLMEFETGSNRDGLCHVCQVSRRALMAYPGKRTGTVMLVDLLELNRAPREIAAHENDLVVITMNDKGTMLATASQKGTLVRIFNTENECDLLYELRRGTNPATIYSIGFDQESSMICVASDHGTVHVFTLDKEDKQKAQTATSGLSAQSLLPKYFSSQVSDVRCCLQNKGKAIAAFSPSQANTLIVLSGNGSYYKYTFSLQGSSSSRETYVNFLDFCDADPDY